jgi:two-component system response regulator GlrR
MAGPDKRRVADTSVSNDLSRARILVVEDQADVRGLLVTALEIDGHDVDEASNAREGLQRLQEGHYDLVLSDFAMPGGTGTWMLHEAELQGLLSNTIALILTAHPNARELSHLDVIPKPLDLDLFLSQVRRTIRDGKPGGHDTTDESTPVTRGHRVEFVLYVSANSPASAQARRNFEQLLERFDATQVKYSICDLGRDPIAGDDDRVAFTPTLVKRYPAPRMWLIGNLRDTDIIADILRGCGVDAKAQA